MSSKGDKFQKRWDIMFDKLEAYAEKHGDCLVPVRWKADPQLGKWVSRQRDGHNAKFLTPERRARLDSIGFVWRCKVGTDQEAGPPVPVTSSSRSSSKKKRKSATSSARTTNNNKSSSTRTAPKRNSTTSSSVAATTTIKTRSTTGSKMPALSTKRTTTAVAANKSRRSSVANTNNNVANAKKSTTPPPIKAKKTAAKPRRVTTATKKTAKHHEDEWASQFEKVVQYKLRNGHTRFPRPYTADPLLGAWVRAQCLQWQRKALSRQRRELLEALDLDFDHHLMRSSSTSTRMNAAAAAAAALPMNKNKDEETTVSSSEEEEASTAKTTEKEEQTITDSSNVSDSTEEEETDDSEATEVEEEPMTTNAVASVVEEETGDGPGKPKTTAMATTSPVVVVGGEEKTLATSDPAPSATPKATTPLGKRRVSSSSTTSTPPAKKNKKAKTDGGNDANTKQVVPSKPSLAKLLLPKKSGGTGNDDVGRSSLPSLGHLAVPFLDADKSSPSSTQEDAAMMTMLREAAMKNKLEKDWDVADQDDRDHLERNWQEQFSMLFRYQGGRSNNGMPVDTGLRAWLETQRDLWRNGFLSLHRQCKLQSIGFDFSKLTSERERGHPYSSMYISYGALATKVALQDAASVNTTGKDSGEEVVAATTAAVEPAFAPPTRARTTEALPQTFGFHDLRVHAPPPSIVKSAAPLSVVTPTTPMATLVLAADLVSAEAALRKTPSAVPREEDTYRHHACEQGSCGTEIGQQLVSMPLPVMGSVLPSSRHIPAVSPSPLSESEQSTIMAPPKNRW